MSQYVSSIPVSSNHTTFTVKARRGRARDNAADAAVPLSPTDRETVEDLKAKKREKNAKKAVIDHRLPQLAAAFRQVMGERVDITWGVGPQQIKMTASGTVSEVTDTFVLLEDVIGGAPVRTFIPFGFVVRWQQ